MGSFYKLTPKIHQNSDLREPQIQAFTKFAEFFDKSDECEAGVVMPVGCGKSGCITIFPFACNAKRTLVVAPNLHITKQLVSDFSPSDPKYFYKKCKIVSTDKFPEIVEIRGELTNKSDLDEADVVITNIQGNSSF